MWENLTHFLLTNQTLSIFICLAIGYWIGKFKIKSFSLGPTVGVLLVGLIVGQIGTFSYDGVVKNIFLDLFIFTIGYEVGPSFFSSLKKSGIKSIIQAVFFFLVAFAVSFTIFKVFDIPAGEAVGILAGALTQSTMIGSSATAITSLGGSQAAQAAINAQMAVGYALTYVFGTVGVMLFLKNVAPFLLGVNLKEETKKEIELLDFTDENQKKSVLMSKVRVRAFLINPGSELVGRNSEEIESGHGHAFVFEQILREGQVLDLSKAPKLQAGDKMTLVGDVSSFIQLSGERESGVIEIFDTNVMNVQMQTVHVILTKNFLKYKEDIEANHAPDIVIAKGIRGGKEILDLSTLTTGDEVIVVGPSVAVQNELPKLGYVKSDGQETDMSFLSIGIVLGLLIGSIAIGVSGISLTLGTIGTLFSGLLFGWYREKHQNIGAIPGPTRWFIKGIGLNLFIATVGLESGSTFLPAIKSMGITVLLLGAVITLLPHIASMYFGKYVLKLTTVENIGGLIGAGTNTASLNAITDETGSSIFALTFTPAFAIGNILLTSMGPIMITLLQ